jgi:predicted ATPase/DNA-binding CsgD family transcriptional regulator
MEPRVGFLPVPATSLVGRRNSQRHIAQALRSASLVTLVGPGGIGKSRLAVAVGDAVRLEYPNGVWHVDLTTVPTGGAIDDAILAVLGRGDHSAASSEMRLNDVVREKSMLLILDNCEHVARRAALVTSQVLAASPGLRVLATSRVALDTVGEHVVPVEALSTPDPKAVQDAHDTASFDAVRLLLARASAASPSFTINKFNFREVAEICARLEGWPLAIELAASHLRSLTPAQLLERFDDRLALSSKDPNSSPRHSSIRAVIAWSWELCEPTEQILWRRASVFAADGFDLDGARAVCADATLPGEEIWRVLDSLVAKSILVTVRAGSSMRFRFLETVQQFGQERQAHDERARCERSHRDYYLWMTATALAAWDTADQVSSIHTGRIEKANVTKAVEWSLTTPGEEDAGLQIAAQMRYHWAIDGSLREGRKTLTQALQSTTPASPARPAALWVLAWVTMLQGDTDACAAALAEASETARAVGDVSTSARVQVLGATALLWEGEIEAAVSGLQSGLDFFLESGDVGTVLFTSMLLVLALAEAGRYERAEEVAAAAVAASETCGEVWGRSQVLWALGYCRWLADDSDAAQETVRCALDLRLDFDQAGRALQLETLVWIAASRREYARAAMLFGGVRELWRRLGTSISAFGIRFAGHSRTCEVTLGKALAVNRFEAHATAGKQLQLEHLVEYALGHTMTESDMGERHLTRRENEVARLVGEGLSTTEIAERLVLSARTIEGHLTHALAKLGLRSRTQLALWAAKRASANAALRTTSISRS